MSEGKVVGTTKERDMPREPQERSQGADVVEEVVNTELDAQLAFFREQQTEFAAAHHRQFVLIHDNQVVGFYPSDLEAYQAASTFAAGTFLIRECLRPEEETTPTFYSRVA